jgi:predicted double-glycine peptidase
MFAAFVAALSIAAAPAIDVPYLPQTDGLCGGAAVAMVLRYWGDTHADMQDFAPLIDRRNGGIADDALTKAVTSRGWRTTRAPGSLEALAALTADMVPAIVLLPDRGDRYHYVVVVAVNEEAVVVHDPAWGPSRPIRAPDFERAWRAAGFWSLVIAPPESGVRRAASDRPNADTPSLSACDARLNRAIDEIRLRGFDAADDLLSAVRAECPDAAGPIRELSGVRFAQRRWNNAIALAREALRKDPRDEYALDLLGSSLFMHGDEEGALRAWNQIGKPLVNRVRIEGLHHVRYQTMAKVVGIQPNMLLTAELYDRARRRLGELPDRVATRLDVRPEADGFATVDVVVVERATVPRGMAEWIGLGTRAGVNRQLDIAVPGVSGQGEVWSASYRWWNNRPAAGVSFAAPRTHALPGVWRFDAGWQSNSYGGAQGSTIVEDTVHGGVTASDWLSGRFRYAVSAGVDAWTGGRKAASVGGELEHAAFGDRLSLTIGLTQWAPMTGEPAFRSAGVRAMARSSTETRGWVGRGTAGIEQVSDAAPLSLWPGAGEGQARTPLLRAHPLLHDGVVDLTGSAFGRTLAYGNWELQRWLEWPGIVRLGLAGFVDVARASRRADDQRSPLYVDAGGGLRLKLPGTPGLMRIDIAHGLRDGANALTIGWLF